MPNLRRNIKASLLTEKSVLTDSEKTLHYGYQVVT